MLRRLGSDVDAVRMRWPRQRRPRMGDRHAPAAFRHRGIGRQSAAGDSSNTLANQLASVGRRQEALAAATEAVEYYHVLVEAASRLAWVKSVRQPAGCVRFDETTSGPIR
jgi:hypothetical protein